MCRDKEREEKYGKRADKERTKDSVNKGKERAYAMIGYYSFINIVVISSIYNIYIIVRLLLLLPIYSTVKAMTRNSI